MGSLFVARRAGMYVAAAATASNSALTKANVGASLGLTPKSRLFIVVVSHTPPITPIAIPTKTSPNP